LTKDRLVYTVVYNFRMNVAVTEWMISSMNVSRF